MRPAPCAVAIRNDDLHAHSYAVANEQAIQTEGDERDRRADLQSYEVDECAQRAECSDDERDRQRVPGGDRQQRPQHGRAALALQTERHGEQPAHRRIDSVKGAQPGERQPRPRRRHGRATGSASGTHRGIAPVTDSRTYPTTNRRLPGGFDAFDSRLRPAGRSSDRASSHRWAPRRTSPSSL